jgi:hypothetical protein
MGGLVLDTRAGVIKGGAFGPAIIPSNRKRVGSWTLSLTTHLPFPISSSNCRRE